ncbi:hypothetical protein PE066_18050 [Ramlibacter tataouinensis]|uniref:hypothetical protein n=1 Tax=Ramlibacter tataouinensis TaxID=94132 RepID=UPI0022F38A81|nr:hypothetical protein [Ramlibacter tataouinensis]WBY01344.1 hypothetical protein PE066_18050 [Ramlibacter tataouinensis]
MHASVFSWWPLLLAAGAAGPAGAQPDPAPAPPPAYHSAFEGYQPFGDQPVASWKAANDTVGRIGGWKAYAREASGETQPAAAPAPGPADTGGKPAQPAPVDERGHGRHGHHR